MEEQKLCEISAEKFGGEGSLDAGPLYLALCPILDFGLGLALQTRGCATCHDVEMEWRRFRRGWDMQ
jgi:hypothetical protein